MKAPAAADACNAHACLLNYQNPFTLVKW
jgi:hypothetical protein